MQEFKISSLFRQYRGLLITAGIAQVLFSSMALTLPWMLKIAIDNVIPSRSFSTFWILAAVMILIYIIRFSLRMIAGYLGVYAVFRILLDVRQRIFKHLQSLSLRFYDEYRTGKLISNVISDVGLLQGIINLFITMLDQIVTMLLITIVVYTLNWKLALMASLLLPLHFINFYYFNGLIRRKALTLQEKMSEVSANLSESIHGIKVVKSFAKEHFESHRFFNTMRPTLHIAVDMNQHSNFSQGMFDMLLICTYLGVIYGGLVMIGPDFTYGDFVAFYTYIGMQLGPIAAMAAQVQTLSQGMAGVQRISKLLRVIPEIQDQPNPIMAKRFKGAIKFEDVSFRYGEVPVIKELNLEIKPGEKVALVGPSGCGKSTISNLLLRFYDVKEGRITMDGIDVRRYSQESYRNNVGVVLQEAFLFSGTLRDNIAYARKSATEEDIIRAAELANVMEFVNKLENGFDTVIGENGASLSGGQKQRLAIARAILKDPSVLILDEATSALDTVSEKLVQQALDTLMENRTTIIIAHRLSTIRNADKIVVLRAGVIEQCGTHDQLIAMEGTYRQLYTTQQKAAAEEGGSERDEIVYTKY